MKQKNIQGVCLLLICLIVSMPITFAAIQNLVYDGNGNLVTGDGKYREYDGLNHLVRVRDGNNATGIVLENFTWHPVEERIVIKDVYQTNGSWIETIYYPTKEFVRVVNATGSYDYNYVYQNGQLISQEDYAGRKLFFHNDHLGSVSLITDDAGNKVEETFYSPFGEIISGGAVSRYDYTGKEFDSATADYDFNARKMKPEWGVFSTPDPNINEFEPNTLNRYSYVKNNPYRYIDPNGLFAIEIGLVPSGGIGETVGIGGQIGGGIALSYDYETDRLQTGYFSTRGYSLNYKGGKLGLTVMSFDPDAKILKDLEQNNELVISGESSLAQGIVGGVDLSENSDSPTFNLGLGGGFSAKTSKVNTRISLASDSKDIRSKQISFAPSPRSDMHSNTRSSPTIKSISSKALKVIKKYILTIKNEAKNGNKQKK